MKKSLLISLFSLYHLFVPFVFVNCGGEDIPYDRQIDAGLIENEETDCDTNDFLTADCVEEFEAEMDENEEAEDAEDEDETDDDVE